MDSFVLPPKLLTDLSSAVDTIRGHPFINVFSHFDADGITSASIIAKALTRAGKEFSVTIFPTLNDENMQIIENCGAECVIVTDLGASYIKRFDAMSCDVVVLDHHTVYDQAERICYANPHLYGIDGMVAGCGATMAFLFAITLDERNWDLSSLAIAGAVGDRQHINGMQGLNTYLLDGAVERKFVEVRPGSLIPSGDLVEEFTLSLEPFIRDVSGNPDAVKQMLSEAGIAVGKRGSDLTPDEAERLSSMVAIKLISQGVTREKFEECAHPVYYLSKLGMDAEVLSALLNAGGRSETPGIGVGAGMGDASCMEKAAEISNESRKAVMDAIVSVVGSDNLHEMGNIQWFDSSESGSTGIICSIIMCYLGNPDKPTIGFNGSEEAAHISSRSTFSQLAKGIDLAAAMKTCCTAMGGEGGGHKIAAGGSFPRDRKDEFLHALDALIASQKTSKTA